MRCRQCDAKPLSIIGREKKREKYKRKRVKEQNAKEKRLKMSRQRINHSHITMICYLAFGCSQVLRVIANVQTHTKKIHLPSRNLFQDSQCDM